MTESVLLCRTCARPRGDNIAEGTRCAACARRQALHLCIAVAVATGGSTLLETREPVVSGIVALVAIIAIAPAFVLSVFLHELTHALTAAALGLTVTRVLVGEGVAWWRIGRDPQLVIGSVPLGNGLTSVLDLRRAGYRWRFGVRSMTAPVASATLALAAYALTFEWPMPARTAALLFAFGNAALAVVTLIPVATFGGRVWSDLAATLFVARADDGMIDEHMLQCVQERMKILVDTGLLTRAIETARSAVAAVPAPLAYSLLAYALHRNGEHAEAAAVARHALTTELDDVNRAYLQTVLDIVPPSAPRRRISRCARRGPRGRGAAAQPV